MVNKKNTTRNYRKETYRSILVQLKAMQKVDGLE